jgi:hypothetical protein
MIESLASTEPWPFGHGEDEAALETALKACASTEPWPFGHGETAPKAAASPVPFSFNGAMAFRPWRVLPLSPAFATIARFNGAMAFRPWRESLPNLFRISVKKVYLREVHAENGSGADSNQKPTSNRLEINTRAAAGVEEPSRRSRWREDVAIDENAQYLRLGMSFIGAVKGQINRRSINTWLTTPFGRSFDQP